MQTEEEKYIEKVKNNNLLYSVGTMILLIFLVVVIGSIYPPFFDNYWLWIPVIGVFMVARYIFHDTMVLLMSGDPPRSLQ